MLRPYDPSPQFFWICSLQRSLSLGILDLFILKGLQVRFSDLRILKELRGNSAVHPPRVEIGKSKGSES